MRRSSTRGSHVVLLALALASVPACGSVKGSDADGGGGDHCPVCDPNATCQGTQCVCNDGWTGPGETCTDVNECETNNGGCDPTATCTNTDGGRDCACRTGDFGDGLSCRAPWVLVGSFAGVDIDPEGFGGKAAGAAGKLLFGPEANGPGVPYLRAFDTTTHELSNPLALPPESQTDFCACGLGDAFLGVGDTLYMLGNHGDVYSVANNVWSTLAAYATPFMRGEAASAFDPMRHVVYLIGGRNSETSAVQLDVSTQVFSNVPGTVPFAVNEGKAWVFSGDHKLYVAGGSGTQRQMAIYDPTVVPDAASWTLAPDAPGTLRNLTGMGEFQGHIWVATEGALWLYDPPARTWRDMSIALPAGAKAATVVGSDSFVLCKVGTGLDIYQLNAIV
jgi:hypothetical protein